MNGLLPAVDDAGMGSTGPRVLTPTATTVAPRLRGGFEVWSLPAYCSWRRSAASTAERPDGAGDDEQGGEERGGGL